jgi:hypothetical protein
MKNLTGKQKAFVFHYFSFSDLLLNKDSGTYEECDRIISAYDHISDAWSYIVFQDRLNKGYK